MCVPYGRRCAGHGLPDTLEALQTHNIRLRRPIKKPFESFNTIGKTMMVTDERRPTNYQKVHFLIVSLGYVLGKFLRLIFEIFDILRTIFRSFTKNGCGRTTMILPLQKLFLRNFLERVLKLVDLYAILSKLKFAIKKCTF